MNRTAKSILVFGSYMAVICVVHLVVLNTAAHARECQLERALDFHVVKALQQAGVTDEQFKALAAAGEIQEIFPEECMAELNLSVANPDKNCEILNGQALSRLLSYIGVAKYLFLATGDAPTYRANIRAILRNYLTSVPHRCWFQGVQMPSQSAGSYSSLTPAQCAQLSANYQACKQQAESAVRACAGTPWKHNCASTIPTCMLPPCY